MDREVNRVEMEDLRVGIFVIEAKIKTPMKRTDNNHRGLGQKSSLPILPRKRVQGEEELNILLSLSINSSARDS